jgi:hypothetical protein
MQGLTLVVSNSTFLSDRGPAVVWSPAIPGRLRNCKVQADPVVTESWFSLCDGLPTAGSDVAPPIRNFTAASVGNDPRMSAGFQGKRGLLADIHAAGSGMAAVDVVEAWGSELRLHAHLPPEAFAVNIAVQKVWLKMRRPVVFLYPPAIWSLLSLNWQGESNHWCH